MSAKLKTVAARFPAATCLLVSLAVTGCPWWPSSRGTGPLPQAARQQKESAEPADRHVAPTTGPEADLIELLSSDSWVHAVSTGRPPQAEAPLRWQHHRLEDLLSRPADRLPDFRSSLGNPNPIVAANAAICLARLGDRSVAAHLAKAVRSPRLNLPLRLAAAEALGSIQQPATADLLGELVDQYGGRSLDARSPSIPELEAELIRALAGHVDPCADSRFVKALRSPVADVRLEALGPWTVKRLDSFPVEATDLRTDPDAQVRAAAMRAIARQQHPGAHQYLAAGLNDHDLRVRIACIEALGHLVDAEAGATLTALLENEGELIRAAAVRSLSGLGDRQAVVAAAADESWRVRLAVAESLARQPGPEEAAVAARMLKDPSAGVQNAAISAVADWPLALAGPILLDGLNSTSYIPRRTAAERLSARWAAAAEFPVDGPPERRTEVLEQLKIRFAQEFNVALHNTPQRDEQVQTTVAIEPAKSTPESAAEVQRLVALVADSTITLSVRGQAIERLVAYGPRLIDILQESPLAQRQPLPEAIYREVLPRCSSEFAALDRLTSEDVSVRRQAAGDLAGGAGTDPLCRLAVSRLSSIAAKEPDSLVWLGVLKAVSGDKSEASARLAYAAVGHISPEVRRRACEHLGQNPQPRHVAVLLPALDDSSDAVRLAAVKALGASRSLPDTARLEKLLAAPGGTLRVETAKTLCLLDAPSGRAALERMAYSNDQTVRRQVAVAMGEIADPVFASTLIHLLDDRQTIRYSALESLPKVVGRDVAVTPERPSPHFAERIDLWKKWHRDQSAAVSRLPTKPKTN